MDRTNMPGNFATCNLNACVRHEQCLRYQAAKWVSPQKLITSTINPLHFTPQQLAEGECEAFVSQERIRLARGFMQALGTIPLKNKKQLEAQLKTRFCQSVYYRIRQGKRPLTPEEQEFVEATLLANGATAPITFDKYEEDYLWDR